MTRRASFSFIRLTTIKGVNILLLHLALHPPLSLSTIPVFVSLHPALVTTQILALPIPSLHLARLRMGNTTHQHRHVSSVFKSTIFANLTTARSPTAFPNRDPIFRRPNFYTPTLHHRIRWTVRTSQHFCECLHTFGLAFYSAPFSTPRSAT